MYYLGNVGHWDWGNQTNIAYQIIFYLITIICTLLYYTIIILLFINTVVFVCIEKDL